MFYCSKTNSFGPKLRRQENLSIGGTIVKIGGKNIIHYNDAIHELVHIKSTKLTRLPFKTQSFSTSKIGPKICDCEELVTFGDNEYIISKDFNMTLVNIHSGKSLNLFPLSGKVCGIYRQYKTALHDDKFYLRNMYLVVVFKGLYLLDLSTMGHFYLNKNDNIVDAKVDDDIIKVTECYENRQRVCEYKCWNLGENINVLKKEHRYNLIYFCIFCKKKSIPKNICKFIANLI